jgi:hypothetical protein
MNEIQPATPRGAAGHGGQVDEQRDGVNVSASTSFSDGGGGGGGGGGLRRRFGGSVAGDDGGAHAWGGDDTAAWEDEARGEEEDLGWRAGRAARAAAARARRRKGGGSAHRTGGGGAGAAAGVIVSVAITSLLLASWVGKGGGPPAASLPRPTVRNTARVARENGSGALALSLPSLTFSLPLSFQPTPARPFTPAELALHDGTAPGRPCALAIMGEVYDVAPGARHYGPGGAYHHFAARDASRAFVTGDFSGPDLTDDVGDFSQDQLAALATWRDFYAGHASYVRVGYVAGGRFFTAPPPPAQQQPGGGGGRGGPPSSPSPVPAFPRPTAMRIAVEKAAVAEATTAAAAAGAARAAASVRVSGGGGSGGRPRPRGGGGAVPPSGASATAKGRTSARPGPPGGFYARSLPARRAGLADAPAGDGGMSGGGGGGGGAGKAHAAAAAATAHAADSPEPCAERSDGAVSCSPGRHPRFIPDTSGGAGSGARCLCYRSQLVSPDRNLPAGCSSEATMCVKAVRKGRFDG